MQNIDLQKTVLYALALLIAGALVYTGKAHAELLLAPLFGALLPPALRSGG